MKTLLDVKQAYMEQHELAQQLSPVTDGKRAISAAKKRLQFLNKVVIYLESSPKAEYITGSIRTLKQKYNDLMEKCPYLDSKNPEEKKVLKKWQQEHEITKIKGQLKFLNYIVS